ncbi:MAG TPA: post-COAP-1 domain-containing protein [Thermoanaerobaculia bacterium]|nr:post-COAP-1 domain-containing protein [Thermoanaerobaculia bacterium]
MRGYRLLGALLVALLLATTASTQTAPFVTRGPYLQRGSPTSVVVRWRTDAPTDSVVRFGPAPDSLTSSVSDSAPTTEHVVTIAELSPGSRYYYSVGSSAGALAGDATHYFATSPLPGSAPPIRIWAFGDAGFGDASQAAVRDAYYRFAGQRATDVWLMLGDNAYTSGTDAEYQTRMFDVYRDLLRNTVLWSTFGNHEALSSISASQSGPYYDAFTFPTAGESGGAPSGTEAYYSFDYGNVHFVCLNSADVPRSPTEPMLTWLRNDLAQNTQQWTVAFFHHPPYSKGSHDSDNPADSGGRMHDMRENALPILEEFGVDLVLTGHSHNYERSFLVDGHYGLSTTLTEAMKVDSGDGRTWSDGAYFRPSDAADSRAGTVHAVSGAAGQIPPVPLALDHPVMVSSLAVLGSLVLDVSGSRLDGMFIDTRGVARDGFSIEKAATPPARPRQEPIADDSEPDQSAGVDGDGAYRLSWSHPPAPAQPACRFRVEESRLTHPAFADAAEEPLVASSNATWQGDPGWTSGPHPGTTTLGYWLPYTDNADTALAMRSPIALPAARAAVLTFSSFESIELDFDYGFVELSADGGPFQTLATFTGDFSGTRVFDLSGFAGQSVVVRFRLTSDTLISFPAQIGWFVDDIRIRTGAFAPVGDLSSSASALDVAGRGAGFWGYRVSGLFGDCAGSLSAGAPSRVRLIEVAGVSAPTAAPSASFSASPNPAGVGEVVSFDGSASRDNDAEGSDPSIVRYFWSFGEGTTRTTTSPTTTHAYAAAGTYQATLTVTDNDGEAASTELLIEVDVPPPPGAHEATGGGQISIDGAKASFGFDAESSLAGSSGHLTYQDRASGVKVQSESVTSLQVSGNRATIRGSCTVNKVPGFTFTVDVVDDSETGGSDTFRIRLSNGYDRGAPLAGGNIEVE